MPKRTIGDRADNTDDTQVVEDDDAQVIADDDTQINEDIAELIFA